jgi:hypothetical protein
MSLLNEEIASFEGEDITRSSTNTAIQMGEPFEVVLWKRH